MKMKTKLTSTLGALVFGFWVLVFCPGCALGPRLETGGAYSATTTAAALPELYVLDSSFDLAYTALDGVVKFERDNRATLWEISPRIKQSLDKLRIEAAVLVADYGTAREAYLKNPTPATGSVLQTTLGKIQSANAAALTVIQKKGNL